MSSHIVQRRSQPFWWKTIALIFSSVLMQPTLLTAAGQNDSSQPEHLEVLNEGDYLYNVTLLRAAPGQFSAMISAQEERATLTEQAGDVEPFWIRHSQGDQWDFMLIYPMGSWDDYYAPNRVEKRARIWESERGKDLLRKMSETISYHEEWFSRSISVEELAQRIDGMGFFHVEMFAGLPGKRDALLEQRRMENRYYEHLDRHQNVLFIREAGSNWDAMTIGFHTSLQVFAEAGTRFSEEEQNEAALAAGFDGVDAIAPYLRSLLSYHKDTLGVRAQ